MSMIERIKKGNRSRGTPRVWCHPHRRTGLLGRLKSYAPLFTDYAQYFTFGTIDSSGNNSKSHNLAR